MTHSEPFLAVAKFPFFSNDYLLKHGSFFAKPSLHPDGYPLYPALGEVPGYRALFPEHPKREAASPLNFAIKQEKPPTPASSPTDIDPKDEVSNGGHPKVGTWVSGSQRLSWDNSPVASYNPDTKMFRCVVCSAVGFLSRIAEHYLGTHTSAKVFQCLHCPYSSTWSRCVRMHMAKHHGVPNAPPSLWKGQPLLEEIFQLLTDLKTHVDSQGRERLDPEVSDKKFVCPKCPYTTDRRDLYLRHENIHKEDKPYHCYVCFKLFNRADHVKKHFLRIHRGHPYDISLVRRRPPRGGHQAPAATPFSVDSLIANGCGDSSKLSDNEVMDLSKPDSQDADKKQEEPDQLRTFQCPHCPWEGVDSWCLKRHLSVHQLRGFECPACGFRASKAERLFTHVYRAHRKLVCTKCKFLTEFAHEFEAHVKECCQEFAVTSVCDKASEDSPNESDDGSLEVKITPPKVLPAPLPLIPPEDPRAYDRPMSLDIRGSVSLMPLHNSISYCFPGSRQSPPDGSVVNGFGPEEPLVSVGKQLQPVGLGCKVEVKQELGSPVQSSSDSGVADIVSDPNDQDLGCWLCGCEFANQSSLATHAELYHRDEPGPEPDHPRDDRDRRRGKRFACAVCSFASDRQRSIIEHMRHHSGETLRCSACGFATVRDSALEDHVAARHSDGLKRCPHCAFPAQDKVAFIRHYRRCHHSKSCLRCRCIKRSLDKKAGDGPPPAPPPQAEVVRPYLHHNPYSRKAAASAISPYAHCNAAMSKVAVAISQLQPPPAAEHKPRKQPQPRRLVAAAAATTPAAEDPVCDIGTRRRREARRRLHRRRRLALKKKMKTSPPTKRCRLGHSDPYLFRSGVNFARHLFWSHVARRTACRRCGKSFRHLYQVLIHRRAEHEGPKS